MSQTHLLGWVDYVSWIRAGHTPRLAALKGTGYGGVDIGAIAVAVSGGSSNNVASSDGFIARINGALLKGLLSSLFSPLQKIIN